MCVFEIQRQLGKVGLSNCPIRILRDASSSNIYFHVEIDENISKFDIEEVVKVCPVAVFEIIEVEDEALIN